MQSTVVYVFLFSGGVWRRPRSIRSDVQPGRQSLRYDTISIFDTMLIFRWLISLINSHTRILDFRLDGGIENVTKLYSNLLPGPILRASCTISRAGPVWKGLGAKFGRKPIEH